MKEVIIDTNILVVANNQNNDVASFCYKACIELLISNEKSRVLFDTDDEIRREYYNALTDKRPYALGKMFLNKLLEYHPQKTRLVDLQKTDEIYPDFPKAASLTHFDKSDRKFAALSVKCGVAVSAATDSDWVDFSDALLENGVKLNLICGCNKVAWLKP